MKRLFMVFLLLAVLLVGCESAEEKAAREQAQREAAEKAAALRVKIDNFVNESIAECGSIEDEANNTFCFVDKALEIRPDDKKAPMKVCINAMDRDLCLFSVAALSGSPSYCFYVKDRVSCKMVANDIFCKEFDNKDECYESQVLLMSIVDHDRSRSLCRSVAARGSMGRKACQESARDEYVNWSRNERLYGAYAIGDLMGFETHTVRR